MDSSSYRWNTFATVHFHNDIDFGMIYENVQFSPVLQILNILPAYVVDIKDITFKTYFDKFLQHWDNYWINYHVELSGNRQISTDINSYRPISNLSFTSKLVEHAVASRFIGHCERNSLFPVRQSAYRKCHSIETAVTTVYNDIVRAVNRGQLTALVLLDLGSAFDTVDHSCLISVLCQRFNIEGLVSDWFT